MAYLYVNSKGQPWRKHSYSAGLDFDLCPYKYYLRRVQGWKERDNKARLLFGRAVESAIQFYHEHGGVGGREEFHRLWEHPCERNRCTCAGRLFKDRTDIVYTKTERDWATLDADGDDLLRLYAIRQPSLPIPLAGQIVFQREVSKEVFPGNPDYGEIEDAGRLDMICWVQPDHPRLPHLDWKPEYGVLRPLIIDMKTSGKDYPEEQGMAAFDEQLRRYSWLSGIHDVAFLVAVKKGRKLQKGSSVTLLADAGAFKAGEEAVVARMDGEAAWLLANDYQLELMDKEQGEKKDKNGTVKNDQTKAAKERAQKWLDDNGTKISVGSLTRQRIQFNAGFVTTESQLDAGYICANQIVSIVNARKSGHWTNKFGVRFPHDNRTDPYFQAFVLKDEGFRQENFVKSAEETMNDLFAEEIEDEI
jgi:hypothetical protein